MNDPNSIFFLPTKREDLPELNEGLADFNIDQIQIQRSYEGESAFGNGDISLKHSVSTGRRFAPSKGFFRTRLELQNRTSGQVSIIDNITLAMNAMSNLFRSAEYRLNGKTISKISENFPQVDTFCQRIYKSKSQLDSQLADLQWMQPSFKERQALTASDGHYS